MNNDPDNLADAVPIHPHATSTAGLREVFAAFGKLGLISFGGPIAHLGYFHSEFVQRRKWINNADYADLVALCQFLPGPASSQVVFALGLQRAGLLGGLLASLCFTLPSALLMIAFAYGVAAGTNLSHAGWLHGLKLAAVAVVAQAVWGMGKNLCPDWARKIVCVLAAAVLLVIHTHTAAAQVGVIAIGGVVGWWLYRGKIAVVADDSRPDGLRAHVAAACALAIFFALLAILPVLAASTHNKHIAFFDSFYRSGSLIFGGGHVVLPLLRAEIVPKGWLSDDLFLAGYGAVQAVPGPLFTFAAYLGTAMQPGRYAWLNGLWCLLAIFLPAWLLIGGALPFWHTLRSKPWAQAFLRGASAAVVGILLAALYSPVCTEAITNRWDVIAALVAFSLLQYWKLPSWLIVLALALAGNWIL